MAKIHPHCGMCKHWGLYPVLAPDMPEGFKACARVSGEPDVNRPANVIPMAEVLGNLLTAPEFSCSLFELKEDEDG